MASVVFMRGVNVGGHKAFRPAALARELSSLDVVNIGAAGTFVVREKVSHARLRAEFCRRIPFQADLMILKAREIEELVSQEPFPRQAADGVRRFASALAKRPTKKTRFPLSRPGGKDWQVKLVGLHGSFVLSLWRRVGKAMLYPNEAVEKELGIPATTRGWDTIVKIHGTLRGA